MDPKNTSTSHGHGMGEWWSQLSFNHGDLFSDSPCWHFRNPTQKNQRRMVWNPRKSWEKGTRTSTSEVALPDFWLPSTVVETMKKVAPTCSTPKIVWVVATQLFVYLHPEPWGRWTHFDYIIFFKGVETQPPSSCCVWSTHLLGT